MDSNIWEYFTIRNILLAMGIAAVVTFIIRRVAGFIRVAMNYPAELSFPKHNLKEVMERCYLLFPKETFVFRGQSFRRGMLVRVKTASNKIFEGELIGINADNVLCVITKSKNFIAADILEHIVEIIEVADSPDSGSLP